MTTSPQFRESPATPNCHDCAEADVASRKRIRALRIARNPNSLAAWIESIAYAIADDVESRNRQKNRDAVENRQPPRVLAMLLRGGENVAPRRGRRRDANAHE